ncbi:MAG: ABC transporter substrate-binding protein [Alphaproteobacteria bacterium]
MLYRRTLGCLILGLTLLATGAAGEAIRFSPGEDAPVALNPLTGRYEEGVSFDPLFCAEEPCIELLHNVFEPLVSTTREQEIEPRLAIRWERLDELTFRFHLRPGVAFHNGEMLDAEAVRFSLLRASRAYGVTPWFPVISRVEVVDPLTVDVVLAERDGLFLHRLANIGLLLPPRYFQEVGPAGFGARPVGTGPFRFMRWLADAREVHLEANPNYWRAGFPKIERLVYKYVDGERALDMLIGGELDLIRRLNPRRTTTFMQTGRGIVVKEWLPQLVLGPFNLLKPQTPLRDPRVRRAINLAVNRDHLIRYGTIGNGRLMGGYTVPEDPTHAGLEPYPFDREEARRLLETAGYGEGLGLSVLVDKQVPPQIENIITVSLERIGITVRVKRASESEFLEELYLPKFGSLTPPSFDILLLSMPAGTINHAAMVPMTLLYSAKPNESAVRDFILDRLYEDAVKVFPAEEAAPLWRKLERYVYDNHLLFIGYQEKAVFGADPRLRFTPRTLMSFWDAFYEK